MRRPCRRVWRTAPSPSAAVVHDLLQRDAHAPVPEQGCAIAAHGSADRPDFQRADLGRPPSSIWPDVICDRDREIQPGSRGENRTVTAATESGGNVTSKPSAPSWKSNGCG